MTTQEARATHRQRFGMLLAVTLVAVTTLTGCVQVACPAIGWMNTLTIELDGAATAADRVQLCVDADCALTESDDGTGLVGLVTVAEHSESVWTFFVDGLPATFTVRALAADGTVLSDTEVTPEWVRTGGTEQCGGPADATVTVGG